tara:strand:- start:428 stop:802 length:375 start_codon:yes stop_codon:yes gene_type:complete
MNKIPAFLRRSNFVLTPEQIDFYNNYQFQSERQSVSITAKQSERARVLNRRQTKECVLDMLTPLITKTSKLTKGALIRHTRTNFKHQSTYADVGKVASKIINQNTTGRFSKWHVSTTARYIRRK